MKIRCLSEYQGWATFEELLEAGVVYEVPEKVAEYLLRQQPDKFEALADGEKPERKPVRLRIPESVVAEVAGLHVGPVASDAVVGLLEKRSGEEQARLVGLRAELDGAKQRHGELAALKATGEATKRDSKALGDVRRKVSQLDLDVTEAEAALLALAERIEEAKREAAQERLGLLVAEHDKATAEYAEGFREFCTAAVALVDLADGLYAAGGRADALVPQVKALALAGLAVPDRCLESVASRVLPPAVVKLDKYLRAGLRDRGRRIRTDLERL